VVQPPRPGDVHEKMIEGFHDAVTPFRSIHHMYQGRICLLQYGNFQTHRFRFFVLLILTTSHVTMGKIESVLQYLDMF
jgi:hypothetical protein